MSKGGQQTVPASKDALLKNYQFRLRDDIASLLSNFTEIIKSCRLEDEYQINRSTQSEEDAFEATIRAANMVRACQSLLKLISDIKQFLILNDFPAINEAITNNSKMFLGLQYNCDRKLTMLRDDLSLHLFELEEEYYNSPHK